MTRVTSITLALIVAMLLVWPVEAKIMPTIIQLLDADEFLVVAPEDVARLNSVYGSLPDISPRPIPKPATALGPGFQIFDNYWDTLARHYKLPNTDGDVPIYSVATYYPDIRVIQLTSDGQQSWFELDSGREAFLQRYIALLEEGTMEPTFFDVLRVALDVRTERIDVKFRLDGPLVTLSQGVEDRFWPALLSAPSRPALTPGYFGGSNFSNFGFAHSETWPIHYDQDLRIRLTMPEGYTVQYTLLRPENLLVRAREGHSHWPAFVATEELLAIVDAVVGPAPVDHRARTVPALTSTESPTSAPALAAVTPSPQPTSESAPTSATSSATTVARTTTLALTLLLLGGGAAVASFRGRTTP